MAGGFRADIPDLLGGEVAITASFNAGWKEPGFGFLPPPVFTERLQQFRAQRHVAIPAALALADVNDHAFAIYILDT